MHRESFLAAGESASKKTLLEGTFQLTTSVVMEKQRKDNTTASKTSPSKRFKTASLCYRCTWIK